METRHIDLLVVGAGLAGLAAARLAQARGLDVVVVEGHEPGGRGATDDRGGYLMNRGPHALYLGGPAEQVLTELGVSRAGRPPSTQAWIRDGDEIVPMPATAAALLRTRLLGWRGKVAAGRLLAGLGRIDASALAGRSFADWLDERDLPPDARRLVEMLGRLSSYSNAPAVAGADMVVGALQRALTHGVRYLDGGWGHLVGSLAAGVRVERAAVTVLGTDEGSVVAHLTDRRLVARAAVVAVGTPAATAAVCGRVPFDVGPPVEASCLDLAVTVPARRPILIGLDQPLYASDHGVSARLAPAGHSVVHIARYLAPGDDLDRVQLRRQLHEHAGLAGVDPGTVVDERHLYRMVVAGSAAPAAQGGLAGRPGIDDTGLAGVWMAGDWVGPHGHLLDASMASASAAVAAAVRHVERSGRVKLAS